MGGSACCALRKDPESLVAFGYRRIFLGKAYMYSLTDPSAFSLAVCSCSLHT